MAPITPVFFALTPVLLRDLDKPLGSSPKLGILCGWADLEGPPLLIFLPALCPVVPGVLLLAAAVLLLRAAKSLFIISIKSCQIVFASVIMLRTAVVLTAVLVLA